MARARSQPQSKHWSWLFGTLWGAAKRCTVRLWVPDTVLWEQGAATRWIRTSEEGVVQRGDLAAPGSKLARRREREQGARKIEAEFFEAERLRMFKKAFAECAARSRGCVDETGENAPICVAEYVDGVREELTGDQLEFLGRHREWRAQLRVLQARVCATSLAAGIFVKDAPASLAPRARAAALYAEAAAAEAGGKTEAAAPKMPTDASELAASLARFVEAAYRPTKAQALEATASPDDLCVEVERLGVEAAVDATGCLWVVRASEVFVVFVDRRPMLEDAEAARLETEHAEKARQLAARLRRLIRLADARNVPFEASFAHFDPRRLGSVDLEAFRKGLSRLGLDFPRQSVDTVFRDIRVAADLTKEERCVFTTRHLRAFVDGGDARLDARTLLSPGFEDDEDALSPVDEDFKKRARKLLRSAEPRLECDTSVARVRTSARQQVAASTSRPSSLNNDKNDTVFLLQKRRTRDDPLSAVPGARGKTRRALRELVDAAKRRRKHPAASVLPWGEVAGSSSRPGTAAESVASSVAGARTPTTAAKGRPKEGDEFFHVEPGTLVMTYRVLKGRPVVADHAPEAATMAQARAALDSERRVSGASAGVDATDYAPSALLVVFPDVFQTLDALQALVEPLLPHLRGQCDALLVGLPGQPNTIVSPQRTPPSYSEQADAVSRLLDHLRVSGRLDPPRPAVRPVVWLGFGNGGAVLARFATVFLRPNETRRGPEEEEHEDIDKRDDELAAATCAVVLVNGFFDCAGPVRKTFKLLAELYGNGRSTDERSNALVDLHLSDKFLRKHGREKALADFWDRRPSLGLSGPSADLVRTALTGALRKDKAPLNLDRLPAVPFVFLQSAADRWVPPQKAPEQLAEAFGNDLRFLATAKAAVADGGRVARVAYLDAGHELAQEQSNALARALVDVLCAGLPSLGRGPLSENQGLEFLGPDKRRALAAGLFDEIADNLKHDPLNDQSGVDCPRDELCKREERPSSAESGVENGDDADDDGEKQDDADDDGDKKEPAVEQDDAVSPSRKSSTTFKGRPEYAQRASRGSRGDATEVDAEAAKRRDRVKRQKEIKRLRKEMSATSVRSAETEERFRMREADLESRASEEIANEADLFEMGLDKAKDRTDFLAEARDREEAIEIEDKMVRDRSRRVTEARAIRAKQEAEELERAARAGAEEEDDDGDPPGPGEEDSRVMRVARAAKHSMAALLEARRKLVASLLRCQVLEGAVAEFKLARTTADHEARRLLRTTKLMETNANLRNSMAPKPKELEELKRAHDAKVDELAHLQEVVASRERALAFANAVAQATKKAVAEKEDAALGLKQELDRDARRLREYRGTQRLLKERAEVQASEQHAAIKVTLKRLRLIQAEEARLRGYTQSHVNCDVWNAGYMQRMQTTDLREALLKERVALQQKVRDLEAKRDGFEEGMRNAHAEQKQADVEATAVTEIHDAVDKSFREATRLSIADELRNLEREHELAARKVADEQAAEALARRAAASASGDCAAARVRHKPANERTVDEKKWVALDVLIHPLAYAHVTEAEAEQMKFDSDYAPTLRPEDVKRVVALPHQLQLALPFLFSKAEIEAHRLVCLFTHDKGEAHYRTADRVGAVLDPDQVADAGDWPRSAHKKLTHEDVLRGQDMLDTMLRERRLVRMRSKSSKELSENEAKYLAIDRVLNPWLYPSEENAKPKIPTAAASSERPGDKYEELRRLYENGATAVELGLAPAYFPKKPDGTPHTRDSLLELAELARADRAVGDPVAALLHEFYVDHRETAHGKRDRGLVQELGRGLEAARKRQLGRARELLDDMKRANPQQGDFSQRDFGGWDAVHPASVGVDSPGHFDSRYNPHRHHPAAFQPGKRSRNDRRPASLGSDEASIVQKKDSPQQDRESSSESSSACIVFRDLDHLNELRPSQIQDPQALFFKVDAAAPAVLLDEDDATLETRTSRTHRFQVPEEAERRFLALTVTIVYRGVFTARGYRVGRLAAAVFRVPTATCDFTTPRPIGYASYEQQQLNTGSSMGRIVIIHAPDKVPLKPGPFQIVVGAASSTRYSVKVEAKAVQTAASKLLEETARARDIQEKLARNQHIAADAWTSMRLSERKILVVQALLDEAEVESSRCERETERCNRELVDDDERMELSDEQRSELYDEVKTLEVEFAHWCRLFASRSQERKDLLQGLNVLRVERADALAESEKLQTDLRWLQRHLPTATGIVYGMQPAVDCALSLNTSFEHIHTENATGQWRKLASARGVVTASLTPAQDVRRRHKSEGWTTLSLPEQQWSVLDRALRPEVYAWLDEEEAEEERRLEEEEEEMRAAAQALVDDDGRGAAAASSSLVDKKTKKKKKKKKKKRYSNKAVRAMEAFAAGELNRIRELPFSRVARGNETVAWKLMKRFHDDPNQLIEQRKAQANDSDRAAGTRFKHPKSMTKEEREWVSLDKILNPALWKGLKIRQATGLPYANCLESEYLKPVDHADNLKDNKAMRGVHFGSKFGSLVAMTVARRTQLAAEQAASDEDWSCELDRDHLIRVWAARAHDPTWTVDECKARKLMEKYNGDYDLYRDLEDKIRQGQLERRRNKHRFVDRDDVEAPFVETDLDARCRMLQVELDAAVNNSNPTMASNVLHGGVGQRFPTHILRLELEAELDALLREQVYERERAHRFLLEQEDPFSDLENDDAGDDSASPLNGSGTKGSHILHRRKMDNVSKEVFLARKAILKERSKDEATKAAERELARLGPRACLACFAPTCQWKSYVDAPALEARRKVLSDELVYIRMNPDMATFESYVPLSAARGGNCVFRRPDLVHELVWEDTQLDARLRLNAVDRELHDAHATRKEYIEITSLHSYPTMMWTNNARKALEREHNRVVAAIVASDVVDDALAYMFEGWYFGERESSFSVAGYVPSIKKDGFVRAGGDQVIAQRAVEERELERRARAQPDDPVPETDVPGSPRFKQEEIEIEAQFRLTDEKVVKAGSEREQHMDFTERTLKFGLFCITLMFFRGMALIQREKVSWSGAHDAVGGDDKLAFRGLPTEERKKMRREALKAQERAKKLQLAMSRAKTGAERTRLRLLKEKEEAARKLHARVRREKQQLLACNVLQAAYRGHLGRKAARRWAIKRAELEAINALMTASAISIQRVFRGYLGRVAASVARMEMAEFISMIRMEEATEDEREYWRTHPFARFKRNARNVAKTAIKSMMPKPVSEEELALARALTAPPPP